MLSSNISGRDYFLDISRGLIPGAKLVHVSGLCGDVDNTEVTVWNTVPTQLNYVFPDNAGESMEVVSSSIEDDVGGSGMEQVTIAYLDTDFLEQTVNVALNGQTPVTVVPVNPLKPIARVNRFASIQIGSAAAAGNIDVRKVGTSNTNIYRRISAGERRSTSAIYTVPGDKYFYLNDFDFASAAVTAGHYGLFRVYSNGDTTVVPALGAFRAILIDIIQDGHGSDDFPIPVRFLPRADIYVTCASDGATANVTAIAELRGWLESA